ncbi:hypothetical protein TSAR_007358 [Trichomalopsis sarcophagae]|uniref:CUB domain-containing protein n=1 Tax=Trichomalopsis sarcophagae TaxID=543379 RepID=A0A232FK80_9HYME|nr:hypothetical protein TSAR_007358 [Trichomalopsis sarcophagae]
MRTVMMCLALACVAMARPEGYWVQFTAKSVKSDIFIPLRANKTTSLINECGKVVTEPLGILEHTYKQGSASSDEKCTWKLHAPKNHVVNVISVLFVLEDEIKPSKDDDVKTSTISLYDGGEAEGKLLTRYFVTPQEKVGYFVQSISSGQDMVVEINYHDNKDFASQKILVNYEFLDVKKMEELLRAA